MNDYYAFSEIPILLQGEHAVMIGKPGVWSWNDMNPGTAALIDAMDVQPCDKVLDLGCGTGLIGLAAARMASAGWVTLVDVNIAAVECARRTLVANDVSNAQVWLSDGSSGLGAFDLALSHLPRGRAVVEALIETAARSLKPGGRFYLVAHKRSGVKSAIAITTRIFGRAGIVRQKQGYHVALAIKGQPQALEHRDRLGNDYQVRNLTLDGLATILVSRPGVFAWDHLDDGTAALIQALELHPGETVLDLGCGTGLLALVAARRGGRVTAVDADLRAVESTRRTLTANQVSGEVLISDCVQAVLGRHFDVVLCNPPFHQGIGVEHDVARQMMHDAASVLCPGGRLYVVSNAFIRYERELQRGFSTLAEVLNNRRYRILRAMR